MLVLKKYAAIDIGSKLSLLCIHEGGADSRRGAVAVIAVAAGLLSLSLSQLCSSSKPLRLSDPVFSQDSPSLLLSLIVTESCCVYLSTLVD